MINKDGTCKVCTATPSAVDFVEKSYVPHAIRKYQPLRQIITIAQRKTPVTKCFCGRICFT